MGTKKTSINAKFTRVAFLGFICIGVSRPIYSTPLNGDQMEHLAPRIEAIFKSKKIVCFSHFILEVPSSATVVYGPSDVEAPTLFYANDADKLADFVQKRRAKIENDRVYLSKLGVSKMPLYGSVRTGALPGQKLLFGSDDSATYSIDSFIPIGHDLFVQRAGGVIEVEESISTLNNVATHIRSRNENEVPLEAGVCIDGGFVNTRAVFERVSIGVRLAEFPDVHFSIDATKKDILVESDALEPRMKAAEQDAKNEGRGAIYARIKKLRVGNRQLGEWNGFELLTRKPAYEDQKEAHEFEFVSLAVPKDPLRPHFDIQMSTGVADNRTAAVTPSVTDEEAVALWDRLTGSIRIRPTGGAVKPDKPQPKTPLGTQLESGAVCPQTGLWQCHEEFRIASTRRKRIVAGGVFPPAKMFDQQTFFQKLFGVRPTRDISTHWKLVDYDDNATPATVQSSQQEQSTSTAPPDRDAPTSAT